VGAVVLDPQRKGQQNIQLRRLLRHFQPPRWCRRVVVLADAGFAPSSEVSSSLCKQFFWHLLFWHLLFWL
jgi:hypothetical protein